MANDSFKDTDAGRARPELADAMDKSDAARTLAKALEPRSEQELREENREQLQREVDASLEALRSIYLAAACWMMIKEFVMQSDGECWLVLEETSEGDSAVARRKIAAKFDTDIGEEDVDNQLDNFVDDLRGAIAVENENREIERRRRRASPVASEMDRG